MTKNQQQLKQLFSQIVDFNDEDIEQALPHFSFEHYESKQVIFSAGDQVLNVQFLMKGIGRYYYIDIDGVERNKSLVRKGGAFASISSVVEGAPSPFYTQAITPCETAVIGYRDLVTLSELSLNWAQFIRKIFERLVLKKEKREAGFLLLNAKQRYEVFLQEFGEDSRLIPLRHIAMYLGVTDVSLSRIRKEMGLT